MAFINHIDGVNRLIYLSSDSVNNSIHPIDIYKEMRTLRANIDELRKYDVFIKAYGNVPKSATTFTERYVVLQNGCKIVPYNTSHILTITGTIITDDGEEGVLCFNRTLLDNDVFVDINYIPKQVEVIVINSSGSGGGLTQDEHNKLMSVPTANENANAVWDKEL